jgi:hypothetical protein
MADDTATQAVEFVPFSKRIAKLNSEQLLVIADKEFNVNIDAAMNADAIRAFLLQAYDGVRKAASQLNEESCKLFIDHNPDERLVKFKFIPLEFANNPLEFNYDGGFGVRGKGGTKLKKGQAKRLAKMPHFKLVPGETYKLPMCVKKHLESLTTRDNKVIHDKETGMVTGNMPVIKPRFMLVPVVTDEQLTELGTTT